MSHQPQDLETAILKWISTFKELSDQPKDLDSLSDGIILTEIMSIISPEYFDMSKINQQGNENWALKFNNLTYLYEQLEQFYRNVLDAYFSKRYVDLLKISKNNDRENLYNLVEIVLGAAVQCSNKEAYINAILTLDETCQNQLMHLIEKILSRKGIVPSLEEVSSNLSTSFENAIRNSPFKNEYQDKRLLSKLEELENENQQLLQKYNDATEDNEKLKRRIEEFIQESQKKDQEIRQLHNDKDQAFEKLKDHESTEDFEKEIKLKDRRINELNGCIEELKQKHEAAILNLHGEINQGKRKINELSKLESIAESYKKKYEHFSHLAQQRLPDLEAEIDSLRLQLSSVNKDNQALLGRIELYKEKLEAEKTKNISLDIDLTKKKAEIDLLKTEKRTLELANNELEGKVNDQNKLLDRIRLEHENAIYSHRNTERAMANMAGEDFRDLMRGLERENETLRSAKKAGGSLVLDDAEKEILEKEIDILKKKCMEIETENQNLRDQIGKSQDVQNMERMARENQNLKEEVERQKRKNSTSSPHFNNTSFDFGKIKELQEAIEVRENEIRDLHGELGTYKGIIEELEEQKLEEARILGGAVHELAKRNLNLENQIKELQGKSQENKENRKNILNQFITPIDFKLRK